MKFYFQPLLNYFYNHPSIKNLSLINKEQQIRKFLEQYSEPISLFVYSDFQEEQSEFLEFLKENVNSSLLPTVQDYLKELIENTYEKIINKDQSSHKFLEKFWQNILLSDLARNQLFINFNLIQNGELQRLINNLFSLENSYTLHLITQEESLTLTMKSLREKLELLLCLSPLLRANTSHKEPYNYLKETQPLLCEKIISNLSEIQKPIKEQSSLTRLLNILQEKAKFPLIIDHLPGSLSCEESWFANKFNDIELDNRIIKELLESHKEWNT